MGIERNRLNEGLNCFEYKCADFVIQLNVSSMKPLNPILTQEIIERVKENEERYRKEVEDALEVSSKSARLTYFCIIYKILESCQYNYKEGANSRPRAWQLDICRCERDNNSGVNIVDLYVLRDFTREAILENDISLRSQSGRCRIAGGSLWGPAPRNTASDRT